jgi:hypothetical protein
MKRTCLPLFAALCFACGDLSDAAGDLVTVELGAEELNTIQIERSVTLGPASLPACFDVNATLPSSDTTVALKNSASGCMLIVSQSDLVLADEQTIERAREAQGPFEVDGIRRGSVEVQSLQLSTDDGTPVILSDYVTALSVEVDGQLVLDGIEPSALEGDDKLNQPLPDPIIEKLKAALENNQTATANVVLTLWLTDQTLNDPPDSLNLRLVLQPELQVDLVDATF